MSGTGKGGALTATKWPVEGTRVTATTVYTGSSSKMLTMSRILSSWSSGVWMCAQAAASSFGIHALPIPVLGNLGYS